MPLRDLTLNQFVQHADRITKELVKKHAAKKATVENHHAKAKSQTTRHAGR